MLKIKNILFFILSLFLLNFVLHAQIVISPSTFYLGQVPVGSNSTRDLEIFNSTVNSINISSISINGSAEYQILNNPGSFTLGGLEKLLLTIQFQPQSPGSINALLDIQTGSGNFTGTLNGAGVDVSVFTTFERILGTIDEDGGSDFKPTSDGGYIIVGSVTPSGEDYPFIYLLKTDLYGNIQWTSSYGDDDGADNGVSIIPVDDGYIVLANSENWGAGRVDLILLKFNLAGEFQWRKTYGSADDDRGAQIISTSDGGYIMIGETIPTSATGRNAFIVKVTADGTEQWRNNYGGSNGAAGAQIVQLPDGNYVFVGFIAVEQDFQIYLVKINGLGGIIWERQLGGDQWEDGYGLYPTDDGGFILCGYTISEGAGAKDAYLVKVDSDGNFLWSKTFGSDHADQFNKVIELPNGGFIAVGSTTNYFTQQNQFTDGFIVRTDVNGNELWSHLYGGDKDDGFAKIYYSDDGGIVILGNTASYSKANDIYFLRLNNNGQITSAENLEAEIIPADFTLYQNYPNPFNGQTVIRFFIPEESEVQLNVYDVKGELLQILIDQKLHEGIYEHSFSSDDYSSGVYFYELISGNNRHAKSMVILK